MPCQSHQKWSLAFQEQWPNQRCWVEKVYYCISPVFYYRLNLSFYRCGTPFYTYTHISTLPPSPHPHPQCAHPRHKMHIFCVFLSPFQDLAPNLADPRGHVTLVDTSQHAVWPASHYKHPVAHAKKTKRGRSVWRRRKILIWPG